MSTDALTERKISQSELDQADPESFAGKGESFPILKPEDVAAAAASIGRAGAENYSTDELKSRIIAIAKRKGPHFVAKLPTAWRPGAGKASEAAAEVLEQLSRLEEAGRTLSAKSEGHIRAARAELDACLSQLDSAVTEAAAPLTEEKLDDELTFEPLVEAARADGTVLLKIASPGWGTTGYYPKEVLERDGPKVFTKNLHNYINHPTEQERRERPEGDVLKLGSVLQEDARWLDNGPTGQGLYARALPVPPYGDLVKAVGSFIGVSMNAWGDTKPGEAEGRKGKIVERLVRADSVDYVTRAGRGGEVLLQECAGPESGSPTQEGASMSTNGAPSGAAGGTASGGGESLTESLNLRIRSLEAQRDMGASDLKKSEEGKAALLLEKARLAEELAAFRAASFVGELCQEAAVPQRIRERLQATLPQDLKMKDGALDKEAFRPLVEKAIKEEMAYYAELTGSGRVTGMGGGSGAGTVSLEEAQRRLEASYAEGGLDPQIAKLATHGRGSVAVGILVALFVGLFFLFGQPAQAETNRVYSPGYHLSIAATDPATPASGDPIRYGKLTGVAQTDERSDGTTSVDLGPGVWTLKVDDNEGSAIAVGDSLYYHDTGTGSPSVHLNNTATSADAFFGVAFGTVSANATTAIKVIHIPLGLISALASNAVTTGSITAGAVTQAKLAEAGKDILQICGDLTTINNNTVYYGPNRAVDKTTASGMTCDTTAAGNTNEATADAPAYEGKAFQVLGMTCRTVDTNATVSFTLRSAAAATTPSVTCSTADNELDCVADVQSTTAIASGATLAVAAASTSNLGTAAFVCNVAVAY